MVEPMTPAQRRFLNASCQDLADQVPWMINGQIRKMGKDQWRHFMVAQSLGYDKAPSIEGDQIVIFAKSSKELDKESAQRCIDLIVHFGDSRQVMWRDPKFISQMREAQDRS